MRFYLFADDTVDARGAQLGARALAELTAGATSPAVTTLTIPGNTAAPAAYRVIAIVDALERQVELEETNNALASRGTVAVSVFRPDLALARVSTPGTAGAGKNLTITHTTRNVRRPAPTTGPFTLRFYLSADDTLDTGDILLGSAFGPTNASLAVTVSGTR